MTKKKSIFEIISKKYQVKRFISVALSLESPPPVFRRHSVLWSSDFPHAMLHTWPAVIWLTNINILTKNLRLVKQRFVLANGKNWFWSVCSLVVDIALHDSIGRNFYCNTITRERFCCGKASTAS